jgi:hypothetical protein
VVIDFGLAAVPGMTTVFSGEVAIGTPAFMAPEQLAGTRVTASADMWSWAVTMVFAGTGELPFKGDSLTAMAYAILHSEPHVGGLPEPLGWLVQCCLNKDAAGRPSARDVLGELVAAGARLVGPMPPILSALTVDEETSGSRRASAVPPRPRQGSGDGLLAARPASGPRSARHGSRRTRWRWRAPILLAVGLLVAAAGMLAFNLPRHGAASGRLAAGSHAQVNSELAAETARKQAVTWILGQVSRAAIVSCDLQVCTNLVSAGFPSGNLVTLGPTSNDPLGSTLVVATGPIRAQYRGRLDSVYAPAVIASFGTGNARIDIRWVYPFGAKAYRAALPAALRVRKTADAQLLSNSNIGFSTTAKEQLLSGQIDPWLPLLLAIMAHRHPLSVVDFASQSPGGGPASLLRWVDVATTVKAAHLTRAAYLGWMRSFIDTQRAEYRPVWVQQVTLRTGQAVLRIGYGAPSPLS